jgi:mono/diheme cytochrome c family protein
MNLLAFAGLISDNRRSRFNALRNHSLSTTAIAKTQIPSNRVGFMLRELFRLAASGLIFVAGAHKVAAEGPNAFEGRFRRIADDHCFGCHGPDVQRAELRLDKLPVSFADKEAAAAWVKVFDRVSRGEMPPKDKERPPEEETRAVLAQLQKQLHRASLARQREEGRVMLRRLNRTEYETTLRDLLGPAIEVKELLPDDNVAAGFDKVSAVLDISSAHLMRYQDAAEKALRTVIPNKPRVEFKERRSGRQVTEKMPTFKELVGKVVRLDGNTLNMYVRTWGHVPCSSAPAPQGGRYRVRASVSAVGTDGKPLPMMLSCRDMYGRDDTDIRGVRDVPAGKASVIEGEFDLKPREVIVLVPWTLPAMRDVNQLGKGKTIDQYAGPGLAVEWVEIEGPIDPWPGIGYERLFHGVPLKATSIARAEAEGRPVPPQPPKKNPDSYIYDPLVPAPAKPREDAARLIRAFLPQAFRRPVEQSLQDYYVKVAHDALDKKMTFAEAMLLAYKAALCSPHFLFLAEPVKNGAGLDDYAVASRLSYFLWSSAPDEQLRQLAAKGELTKPEVRRAQVERMLNDPKANRFTANFAGQWLDLRNINATSPDPQIYGEFDDFLFWSMPRETEMFFEEILHADHSLTDFVHSDWSFLNERLAKHYGIANVAGGELRKVKLPKDSHRGGVLTHAAIMKVSADGTRTSPVLRGKWVLDRILGQPPAPPPPDIPAIEPDIRGATTIRQQLDKHRHTPACATCHKHIDPPGFALENFDVIGGWRDFYRGTRGKSVDLANYPGRKIFQGLAVEKGGETPAGKTFKDIDEYKQLLLADKDQLARNLIQKLIVFSTGADIQFADREVVEQMVAKSRERNYGFRSLVHAVVESRVFLNK